MQLLDNWKDVVTKAWSARLIVIGIIGELLLDYASELGGLPSWAVIALLVAVLGSRLVAQKGLSLPKEDVEAEYDGAL